MAKEKKTETAPVVANQAYTVENVIDELKKGNLMDQTLTKQVKDKIKQEQDELKANELKERILKASYRRIRALLQLRARRRESEITKERLQRSEILEDKLSGFVLSEDKIKKHGGKDGKLTVGNETFELGKEEVWVPGTITTSEYDNMARDLSNDIRKKMSESDKELEENMKELRAKYPGYWRYDWED
jgi:hypothetical protein